MDIQGYGCTVSWDGQTLRAKGTNKMNHLALMGPNRDLSGTDLRSITVGSAVASAFAAPDELVLDRDAFTVETFKQANVLVNGNLTLRTSDGIKHQMHFRRKQNADFEELANALR